MATETLISFGIIGGALISMGILRKTVDNYFNEGRARRVVRDDWNRALEFRDQDILAYAKEYEKIKKEIQKEQQTKNAKNKKS